VREEEVNLSIWKRQRATMCGERDNTMLHRLSNTLTTASAYALAAAYVVIQQYSRSTIRDEEKMGASHVREHAQCVESEREKERSRENAKSERESEERGKLLASTVLLGSISSLSIYCIDNTILGNNVILSGQNATR
jgi:hypothetical protein